MVSIIIPVYNGEKYIEKALKSVLNQTYKDIEIIVVDDGSKDRTKEIVNKYNIKYVYQKNSGPSVARNRGILEAKGEYIAFLDADDMYLPNKIEIQVNELKKDSKIGLVYNNVKLIDNKDEIISVLKSEKVFDKKEDFFAYCLFRQPIPCPPSIMVRKQCFNKVKYPVNYVNAEDYLFILNMSRNFKFKSIDKVLYLYRRHSENLTNKHLLQLNNEVKIVKEFGDNEIKVAISKTSFSNEEKNILYAKIMIKLKKYVEAKDKLLKCNEKNALTWFYIGNCYFKLNEFKEAKSAYLKSINLNSYLAEVHNNLGCIYKKIDKIEQAINEYKIALKIQKNYMDSMINLENIKDKNCFKFTDRELRKILISYID